jgi:cell wall-associated NlpC family hydrolase
MTWFFENPVRVAQLQLAVESWEGTPFRAYGAAKGPRGGVDCVRLAYEVLTECEAIPQGKQFPKYSMDFTMHEHRSPICEYIDSELAGYLHRIPLAKKLQEMELLPGDLLGFRLGNAVHHVSVYAGERRMLQAFKPVGARLLSVDDATFAHRCEVVYRASDGEVAL